MLREVTPSPDGRALTLTWADGDATTVAATTLRVAARDAVSERERLETGTVRVIDGLHITAIEQVGATALHVAFSDGHARAIYPFAYLAELSGRDGK